VAGDGLAVAAGAEVLFGGLPALQGLGCGQWQARNGGGAQDSARPAHGLFRPDLRKILRPATGSPTDPLARFTTFSMTYHTWLASGAKRSSTAYPWSTR